MATETTAAPEVGRTGEFMRAKGSSSLEREKQRVAKQNPSMQGSSDGASVAGASVSMNDPMVGATPATGIFTPSSMPDASTTMGSPMTSATASPTNSSGMSAAPMAMSASM